MTKTRRAAAGALAAVWLLTLCAGLFLLTQYISHTCCVDVCPFCALVEQAADRVQATAGALSGAGAVATSLLAALSLVPVCVALMLCYHSPVRQRVRLDI